MKNITKEKANINVVFGFSVFGLMAFIGSYKCIMFFGTEWDMFCGTLIGITICIAFLFLYKRNFKIWEYFQNQK